MRKIFLGLATVSSLLLTACESEQQPREPSTVSDEDKSTKDQAQDSLQKQVEPEDSEDIDPPSGFLRDEVSARQIADQINCERLQSALSLDVNLEVFRSRSADISSVDDPYDAEEFVQENTSWMRSPQTNDEFLESLDETLRPELEQLVDENLEISSEALGDLFPDTFAAYENQIRKLATDACGFSDDYRDINETTKNYDAARTGIVRKAENVPWYPRGYEELTASVAYQSLDPSQMNCGYNSRHDCYQAKFIAKTQCNLFVEVSFIKEGLRVDDGIDSAYVGPSSPALLSFTSFDSPRYSGQGTVRLEDITCY